MPIAAFQSVDKMKTLLLNSDYTPLSVVSYEKAIVGCFKGKYKVVENYDRVIRSAGGLEWSIPAVIVHTSYQKKGKKISCKIGNLAKFYNFKCVYCLKEFGISGLTKDHVIPRIRGGKTNWGNIVPACFRCNSSKGDKLWKPAVDIRSPRSIMELYREIPPEWEPYAARSEE